MKAYLIAGALLAMTAGAACAQPAPGKGPRPDADGDGKVTLAEFKASRAAQMMRMDTDRDGKVSKAEFQAGMAARKARAEGKGPAGKGPGDGSRMFGMVDGNGDGALDKAELGKMAERRFGRMDADGDGVLTAAERQAGRQGMMDGGA
jgi:hypothetical protein